MTPAERSAHLQRMQAIAQQREADKSQRQHDAATAAAQRWEAALPAPADHPYLAKKGVHAHGTRVEPDGFLIVPMRDTNGKLWNIERINPANFKDKKGLLGGRRTGLYYSIGKPKSVLIVCEGFATGASIHEATGDAVAVAFNAGNLREVAQALHSKYPKLRLILASDDDAFTDGNPGITKATEAARAVGGYAENFPQHIALPRGCFDAARELLADNGIRLDLRDERHAGTPVAVGFSGTLRPDQEASVAAMLRHDDGVLCAPTAFGKTVTAAAIIARRGVNTLVLVHRTELLK